MHFKKVIFREFPRTRINVSSQIGGVADHSGFSLFIYLILIEKIQKINWKLTT